MSAGKAKARCDSIKQVNKRTSIGANTNKLSHHGCCSLKHMLITRNSANEPPTGDDIIVFHVYMGIQKPMFGKISNSVTLKLMCVQTKETGIEGNFFHIKKNIYMCRLIKAVTLEKDTIKRHLIPLYLCLAISSRASRVFLQQEAAVTSTIGAAAA